MTAWRSAAAALAVLCVAVPAPAHAQDNEKVPGRTLFTMDDEAVIESSGLVDAGRVVYTTNDSGDDAVIYGFDPGSVRAGALGLTGMRERATLAGGTCDIDSSSEGTQIRFAIPTV